MVATLIPNTLAGSPLNDPAPNSDTAANVNPWKDKAVNRLASSFTAKHVTAVHSKALGTNYLELTGGENGDSRIVVVELGSPLHVALCASDRRIASLDHKGQTGPTSRELFPRFCLTIKQRPTFKNWQAEDWKTIPNARLDDELQAVQAIHLRLSSIGARLGLNKGQIERIVRTYQQKHEDGWPLVAVASMRAARAHSKPYRAEHDNDYQAEWDNNAYPQEDIAMPKPNAAPPEHAELTAALGHAKDGTPVRWAGVPKELAKFWSFLASCPGGFNERGIVNAERENIVHDAIGKLHETTLTRGEAVDAVLKYMETKFDNLTGDNVAKTENKTAPAAHWYDDPANIQKLKDELIAPAAKYGVKPSELEGEALAALEIQEWGAVPDDMTGKQAFQVIAGVWRDEYELEHEVVEATPPTPSTLALVTKDSIRASYTTKQHGNDYLTVQGRVLIFRLDHPDWGIETEHIILTEETAAFKATIRNVTGQIIACGHGMASLSTTKNLGGRYVEKAETAAIGRALAHAGFGTDSSLDDSDYLADSPLSKAA